MKQSRSTGLILLNKALIHEDYNTENKIPFFHKRFQLRLRKLKTCTKQIRTIGGKKPKSVDSERNYNKEQNWQILR